MCVLFNIGRFVVAYNIGKFTMNKTIFSVLVDNIGNVYCGEDKDYATTTYDYYVELSQEKYGRAADESVYLLNQQLTIRMVLKLSA